jgi:hypothetical protein
MLNFFKKNYKIFLWIPNIREIYVKLFINSSKISKRIQNLHKIYKLWSSITHGKEAAFWTGTELLVWGRLGQ